MPYIHKEDRTLNNLIARIQGQPVACPDRLKPMYSEPVPEPNRSKILGFYRSLKTEELSMGRMAVLIGNIYRISIWIEHRSFEELTKEDVVDLLEKIRTIKRKKHAQTVVNEPLMHRTIENYKQAIKKFWKYLKPQEDPMEYPPEVRWIRRKKEKNGLLPENCWTPEEIMKLANATSNLRDRAFILGLFGSGCRIGEFLPLRRKDCIFDKYSCQILVNGKTGSRRVRITPGGSLALAAWLDLHSNKDPEAYVWLNIQMKDPKEYLKYNWAHKLLKDTAKKSGVNKAIRPHLMRHSLASTYASRVTEQVMNEHFGWRQGGRTVATYVHLSGKQVDSQILAACGKKVEYESEDSMEAIKNGGFPISQALVTQIEREKEQVMMRMIMTLKDEVDLLKAGSQVNSQIAYEPTMSGGWLKMDANSVFMPKEKGIL